MCTTRRLICNVCILITCLSPLATAQAVSSSQAHRPGCWPQEYSIQRDDSAGILTLSTPYYTVQHDLKKGGAISKIGYTHGRLDNLLVEPMTTSVRDENGTILRDIGDHDPRVGYAKNGNTVTVTVDCNLVDNNGVSGATVRTIYEYRWGYIKIRKEFYFPAGSVRIKNLNVLSTVLDPSLSDYGYREGTTEEEGAAPFGFGICQWKNLRDGASPDQSFKTPSVPRYLVFANQGIEGIEWFVSSDLSQWDLQLAGQRGKGLCKVDTSADSAGISVSICPLDVSEGSVAPKRVCRFDYYIGMPVLEGHANRPWLHSTFNRNQGNWVSEETVKGWFESGIRTVHCHNDGDYYEDGLFWRDGSYPPYPPEDMKRYDKVIEACHRHGIRVATYFSNKELHSSTEEFQQHGQEWARKDSKGNVNHNYFRAGSEFGVQMCLKSGWLEFFKSSVDMVLRNHELDGVYYDWNAALLCSNPAHVVERGSGASADNAGAGLPPSLACHWDMDELIELMEWTRQRVGPNGLVIVHNTRVPMFVIENFANYVVGMEWGYKKWTDSATKLEELPLEWDFVGARSRGVIGYGIIDQNAPRRLHKLLAIEALFTGVAPWPASPEAIELYKILEPLGDIEQYKFEDWRNKAVTLDSGDCASAVYSSSGQAYILLGNFDVEPKKVLFRINPRKLPCPLSSVTSCQVVNAYRSLGLDLEKLTGGGEEIGLPPDGAVLVHIR
ncbi:MAG: hypothetical protein JXN61_16145 [Sedimentisphaerales bacterium]|nr:hypothetical protein [Sedimentisphaerales bacterium]